jgi:superfamily II DNA or RNA helicase
MGASPTDALLALVRRNCRSGLWSSGVTLQRSGAVAVESRNEEEVVLRVRMPGRPVAATVVLYPGEREWDCDCAGRVSPCEHVAAAVIALGAGAGDVSDESPAAPSASTWGRVAYRFSRAESGLKLRRFLVAGDGSETPLGGTLSSILAQPGLAGTVQPEQYDLKADLLLEAGAGGILAPSKLDALLRVLVGARQVLLDGLPMVIVEEEVLPRAVIEDLDGDTVVTIGRDPRILEVVSPGVAQCSDGTLARLGETELTGAWLQHLPIRNRYRASERAELVTRVLPDLSRRMAVEVRSHGLPQVVRDLEPRVVLELNQLEGVSLSVLPTLVYGSPPCVRIDDGKMVHLRGPVPARIPQQERRLIERLRDELHLMPGRRARFDGTEVGLFVEKLRRWRGSLTGDAAGVVGTRARLTPRLSVDSLDANLDSNLDAMSPGMGAVRFDLRFEVSDEGAGSGRAGTRFLDAGAVVRAWQEGLGLCPLEGGGWAPLPLAWLAKHGQRLADLLAAREADGRLATHALPALGLLCEDLDQPPPPRLDRLVPLLEGWQELPRADLPPGFAGTLRPYQQRGVDWLWFLRRAGLGGILADDMGLGKTVQAAATMVRGQKTLVVCPTSVLPNWQAELHRFRPDLGVCAYHGSSRKLAPDADVVLTSYALLRLDAERLAGAAARRWNLIILDEAQTIKNPDSQIARTAFALEGDCRLALTGTPVENRLDDLWSLLHFCNRGLLGGRRDFEDRFARPISEGVAAVGDELRRKIRPFVLRRLKREVAPELPPRTESVLRVALDDRERELYDSVRAATRADLIALLEDGGGVMKALEALLRLRQAACHPALLPGQQARTSSKVERLVEALEVAALEGHKALVFSQWTSLLDLIEPRLTDTGLAFVRLDGTTRDRGEVVSRFQSDDGPPVMLISLKAGGVGLNLTAADHVFLCDPWWNPAVEAQAADRAHRIGQDKPVMVYRLVATDTVEERVLTLQEHKQALFDAALSDAGAAAALSRDDLLELLS